MHSNWPTVVDKTNSFAARVHAHWCRKGIRQTAMLSTNPFSNRPLEQENRQKNRIRTSAEHMQSQGARARGLQQPQHTQHPQRRGAHVTTRHRACNGKVTIKTTVKTTNKAGTTSSQHIVAASCLAHKRNKDGQRKTACSTEWTATYMCVYM